MSGALFLVPVPLGDAAVGDSLPPGTVGRVRELRRFLVEDAKSARAFLKAIDHPGPIGALAIEPIPGELSPAAAADLVGPIAGGEDAAIVSEAGAPCVADPGAALVRAAHARGIRVVPLVGPSAILLALMASGLDAQRFAFHGYLPVDAVALERRLRRLEVDSRRAHRTDVFIETPYRNDRMVAAILKTCAPDTLLCIASDITLAGERIATRSVAEWRRAPPALGKRPTVFLLRAAERR